jgi:hypothetical protein
LVANEDSHCAFVFKYLEQLVKDSHEQEFFIPEEVAFIIKQIFTLLLTSITRSKLVQQHMDFH